jgi:hypothetical protein
MTKLLLIALAATGLLSCIAPPPQPIVSTPVNTNPPPAHKSPPKSASSPFIGLTETEAGQRADNLRLRHRVVQRDGVSFPVTMDYFEERLNFAIANGRVIRVTRG